MTIFSKKEKGQEFGFTGGSLILPDGGARWIDRDEDGKWYYTENISRRVYLEKADVVQAYNDYRWNEVIRSIKQAIQRQFIEMPEEAATKIAQKVAQEVMDEISAVLG